MERNKKKKSWRDTEKSRIKKWTNARKKVQERKENQGEKERQLRRESKKERKKESKVDENVIKSVTTWRKTKKWERKMSTHVLINPARLCTIPESVPPISLIDWRIERDV